MIFAGRIGNLVGNSVPRITLMNESLSMVPSVHFRTILTNQATIRQMNNNEQK